MLGSIQFDRESTYNIFLHNLYPFFKKYIIMSEWAMVACYEKKLQKKNLRKGVQFVTHPYVKIVPNLPKIHISDNIFASFCFQYDWKYYISLCVCTENSTTSPYKLRKLVCVATTNVCRACHVVDTEMFSASHTAPSSELKHSLANKSLI